MVDGSGSDQEVVLHGGVANAGAVTRVGNHVLRPSNPHTPVIHRFLTDLRDLGFDGAPRPLGVDPDGRERLEHIEGDVAVPPFPAWSQTDEAVASVARLLARFHAAAARVDTAGSRWSAEMVDPGAPTSPDRLVLCHNDVCLENVVFRDGVAVALLDFDFAAPGRAVHDLAAFVTMCVPVDDDRSASANGFLPADRAARVRRAADAYGLDRAGRTELLTILDDRIARGGEWLRAKAEAGHPGFLAMWASIGGQERFDRRRRWWAATRPRFVAALG